MFGQALPLQETVRQIGGRVLPVEHGVDSAALRGAVRLGYSRRLAYLRRHQRVSITALNETFYDNEAGNALVQTPSATMPVDVCLLYTSPRPRDRG